MTHQAASATIWKNLLLVFLIFFLVFALLSTGLSFIYQPILGFLVSVPAFTFFALFALIMTLIIRQTSVEQVPANMVGLVKYSNGTLKTLAPAGPAWVWFGREHLSGFLSLEAVSVQAPLLGLRSYDGVDLAPLVTLITWRIHSTITTLLDSQYRQEVMAVALESQAKRERRVRDTVTEVMARRAAQETLAELEEHIPSMIYNGFGQEVIEEVNQYLTPIGLTVERLECIGSITTPTKASVAVKTIGSARKKLESLLRDGPAYASLGGLQERMDALLQGARRAVQEMGAASRAVDDYVQMVIDGLQQARQHFRTQSDIKAESAAQKAQSQRLAELAAEINLLLKSASEIKSASEQMSRASSNLTKEELDILFRVLEAIEQKQVSLGSLFA